MATVLPLDSKIIFPDFTIISASAGSGKTHTLTLKVLQLLLSQQIPNNRAANIVAMTFTNNAAEELRSRVIHYLKQTIFGDRKILDQLKTLVSAPEEELRQKAGTVLTSLFDNYNDFKIGTIDSFLTSILKGITIELGFPLSSNIVFSEEDLLRDSLELFLNETLESENGRKFIENVLSEILDTLQTESAYLWDPLKKFYSVYLQLLKKFSHFIAEPYVRHCNITPTLEHAHNIWHTIQKIINHTDTEPTKYFQDRTIELENHLYDEFFLKKSTYRIPIKKHRDKKKYDECIREIKPYLEKLKQCGKQYANWKAQNTYMPYLKIYESFKDYLEYYKHKTNTVTLSDVTKNLASQIQLMSVPELYYYLSEMYFHFLIDEFQDTSPLQWTSLMPLCENALSNGGSLFIVGDTKQSIYSFRGADWQIMKTLMTKPVFLSAQPTLLNLTTNYRCAETILMYVQNLFHNHIPSLLQKNTGNNLAVTLSGLSIDSQIVDTKKKGKGYVNVIAKPEEETNPWEKNELVSIVQSCIERGYTPKDIAILTQQNEEAISVSVWLQENSIECISYSSLDIRNNKIIQELIALLHFLDSPTDDLAFATFLLGDIFYYTCLKPNNFERTTIEHFIAQHCSNTSTSTPLYRAFENSYNDLWNKYFDQHFKDIGYLSLYDITNNLFKQFELFQNFFSLEAILTQFLEVLHRWEAKGNNNVKDFLQHIEKNDDWWNIEAPALNAVSVMTIHKAKGLGFPIVIVLLYDHKPKNDNYYIVEENNALTLYSIPNSLAELSDDLLSLKERHKLLSSVDEFNKLYVALTRAEMELYILCVIKPPMTVSPYFIPGSFGTITSPSSQSASLTQHAAVVHTTQSLNVKAITRNSLQWNERKRGEALHALLAQIITINAPVTEVLNNALKKLNKSDQRIIEDPSVYNTILSFLGNSEVHQLFADLPQRKVYCEQPLINENGKTLRIDRMIVDTDTVTLVEFKTGQQETDHEQQVREYLVELRKLFPEHMVRGVLAYIDKNELRWFQ